MVLERNTLFWLVLDFLPLKLVFHYNASLHRAAIFDICDVTFHEGKANKHVNGSFNQRAVKTRIPVETELMWAELEKSYIYVLELFVCFETLLYFFKKLKKKKKRERLAPTLIPHNRK